jgi:4-hydroxybenzoate polyprenyltransferase
VDNSQMKPAAGAMSVLGAAVRYTLELVSGRAREPRDRRAFAASVTSALRPHFFVFPAGAALVGASGAPYLVDGWRVVVAAVAAGLGWGVGQLLNDLLDIEADAIDAPHRPSVRGLLPLGPTAAVALGLAVLVTAATLVVHSYAAPLAALAAILLGLYAPAKRVPLLGNLAHAALVATAALIGRAAAMPDQSLLAIAESGLGDCSWAGAVAALYIEANYEKDRVGDARAGYRTLAHVLGVRQSALLRSIAALLLAILALRFGFARGVVGATLLVLGVSSTLGSTAVALLRGNERAALAGYRFAIHATAALMLTPVARLSAPVALVLAVLSVLLVERAFQLSSNP